MEYCAPECIRQIHKEYLMAGSNIISANTFGVNAFKCKNLPYTVDELRTAGIQLVQEAIQEVRSSSNDGEKQPMYAALDIGSIGKLLKPLGEISFDEAYKTFQEIIVAGDRAGQI